MLSSVCQPPVMLKVPVISLANISVVCDWGACVDPRVKWYCGSTHMLVAPRVQWPGSLMPKLHPLMRTKGLVRIQHFTWSSDIAAWYVEWQIRVDLEQLSSLICCVPGEEREVLAGHEQLSCKIWPFLGQSEKALVLLCVPFWQFQCPAQWYEKKIWVLLTLPWDLYAALTIFDMCS